MKSSGIGGQAVIEGVMMMNKDKYAVAVRKPDKEIVVDTKEFNGSGEKKLFFRLPVIRGVVKFIETMRLGIKILNYSASFYEEDQEDEPEKEKEADEKAKNATLEKALNIISIFFAAIFAVGLFMLVPYGASQFFGRIIASTRVLILIEGCIRILLFVGYVSIISLMKDIRRIFMYHGAEHKAINCIENGYALTVENVKKQSTYHKRCGTSFLIYVIFISVILFMFINMESSILRLLLRILLVPVIAGISYEIIRVVGKTDNKLVDWISKPGFLLQRLTTREPDPDMIEVAIASVEAVFDWREFVKDSQYESISLADKAKEEQAAAAVWVFPEEKPLEAAAGGKVLDKETADLRAKVPARFDASGRRGASFDPSYDIEKEEDDEVLKALDKYFVFDSDSEEED